MTSSWSLTKRKQMRDLDGRLTWDVTKFGNPNDGMGGEASQFITPGHTHECPPGYVATSIGNPYGFLMCSKKEITPSQIDPSVYNGYNRYQADLYTPNELPRQISDAYGYYDRVIPNESFLHQYDYIAREIRYDGIGVTPLRTPGPRPYAEYGFSYTKDPPYKYDIQQLHQKYPLWKEEQIHSGATQEEMDEFDKNYADISGMGVW